MPTPSVDTTAAATFYAAMSARDDYHTWDVFTRATYDAARDVVAAVAVAEMKTEQRAACERGEFEGDVETFRETESAAWDDVGHEMAFFTDAVDTEAEAGTPGSERRAEAARRREADDYQSHWNAWCA